MILKLAWKNIWRNKRRTFITISAIAFAVLCAAGMRSMRAGMEERMLETIVKDNLGYLQIQGKDFWDDQVLENGVYSDDELINKVLQIEEVEGLEKKLESGTLSSTGNSSRGAFVMSYDQSEGIPKKILNNITAGDHPEVGQQEILMGEELAGYLDAEIGDTIVFLGQGYQGSTAAGLFVLKGTIDTHIPELNRMVAYMPMSDLQEFINAPELITALLVNVKDPTKIDKTKQEIQAVVGDDYRVMTWVEMNPELKQLLDSSIAEGVIMNFILYMILTFVIFGTILMATQERKYELGVLTAIGMKKGKSMIMVVAENVIISFLGALVGIAMVAPIAYYFHNNPIVLGGEAADMYKNMGFDPVIPFSIDPTIAIDHATVVVVISMVLLLYPIFVIRRLKPVNAMKL
ncbi:MAG: ABC transporter permease [Crocinitomicaceae bacterium]|nr:ABC transporter permease [Crocinitomicaceae bacterium]